MAEIECKEIKLTVPWGHIAAKTYGPTTGERVLLVHGSLDNAGSFDRLMKYLPIGFFYYVCIDLPGHGWSSHFPSWAIVDIMLYAHSIHFILQALQWNTCIYIGHSMGVQLGFIFSVFQPHRIKKIIAFDALLIRIDDSPRNVVQFINNASALSIEISNNMVKPLSYTKEEILYAFQNLRFAPLTAEAAEAVFERAVTKKEKYTYNRDIRLKNSPFMFISMDQANEFNSRLSVPIYLFVASKGFLQKYKREFASAIKAMNPRTMCKIINIDGHHDVHNNNPEKVAPFVCKILTSNDPSKL